MDREEGLNDTTVQTLDNPKLCRNCRRGCRGFLEGWDGALCTHPALPINLVTGERVFPCIIARGFDGLCGPTARYFEPKD